MKGTSALVLVGVKLAMQGVDLEPIQGLSSYGGIERTLCRRKADSRLIGHFL